MKELTIEQKAQRYDEISKEVKDYFDGKLMMYSDVEQTLNYLFPELGESEDERIRGAIIDHLKDYNLTEWAAWLEKQGEKPQGKSALEVWKDMRLEVYQQASGNRHEPNYSDDSTKMFSLNDIDEIIEKISEQKPTWSDKDEEMLKWTNGNLTELKEQFGEKYGKVGECISWLKSLKERLS